MILLKVVKRLFYCRLVAKTHYSTSMFRMREAAGVTILLPWAGIHLNSTGILSLKQPFNRDQCQPRSQKRNNSCLRENVFRGWDFFCKNLRKQKLVKNSSKIVGLETACKHNKKVWTELNSQKGELISHKELSYREGPRIPFPVGIIWILD